MLLIVENMLNQQQNSDILYLCERVGLEHKKIQRENLNGNVLFMCNGSLVLECLDKKKKDYLVLGSYGLAEIMKHEGFTSGHNLENLTQQEQMNHWGKSLFLNGDNDVINLEILKPFEGKRFFRPLMDTKSFTSGVYSFNEVLHTSSKEPLIMSSVKNIDAEYRFVIVNGKIADNSSYKILENVNINEKAPLNFVDFVDKLIKKWTPTKHFVLDVASINSAPKIIEINNIHCSRFYGCSIEKIIENILY